MTSQVPVGYNADQAVAVQGVEGMIPIGMKMAPIGITNLSGTIAVGGTHQPVDTPQAIAQTYFISNPSAVAELLWFNAVGGIAAPNAAGSFPLRPQIGTNEGGYIVISTNLGLDVYGATTGHAYTVMRLTQ